ncbi:branched-chain amino acid aminotransferase [Mycolicibacterium aubagnense]
MTDGPLEFTVSRASNPASDEVRAQVLADPGFGRFHTDHMVSIDYTADRGWHDARVTEYGPIELDPSAIVLHYAQEVFEGLKAYRWNDGSIVSSARRPTPPGCRRHAGAWPSRNSPGTCSSTRCVS